MRKFFAAALALPVIATLYLPVLLRRSIAARVGLAVGVGAVVGIAALGIVAPRGTVATPPSTPAPVATTAFGPAIKTGLSTTAGLSVTFSRPMDKASVAAAVSVTPTAGIKLAWNADATTVTVQPSTAWATATFYTVVIGTSATDSTGMAIASPTRSAFVTRGPTTASLAATKQHGTVADVHTGFSMTFDHPVSIAAASSAFRISPAVAGTFSPPAGTTTANQVVFTPNAPLDPNVAYQVSLDALTDVEGVLVDAPPAVSIETGLAPQVVRFRPRNGTTDVAQAATLSVRFTVAMDRETTAAAFSATAGGKVVAGKVSWAEKDTVLVFTPAVRLAAGVPVKMAVADTAMSATGTELSATATATATTYKQGKTVKPTSKSGSGSGSGGPKPKPKPIPHSSGGSVGSGSWHAVEVYYLHLMNCTRTGGWVTSSGSCSSPGGLSTSPIVLDAGLSAKVSRPYAKLLASNGACDHFINGTPTDRLHRAGYSGWAAENIGCRSAANGYASVLGTHLFFQDEKPCGGYCHYANLMNPAYQRCGIGVWIANGRIRLVIDFYHS